MAETLGEMLSARRRKLGKTLAEAEKATKIRLKRLEALEHGEWESLPNPAYVKGYIISYAQFLEMDPEPLLVAFRKEVHGHQRQEEEQDEERRPARQRVVAPRETVVAPREHVNSIPVRSALALVAVMAVLVLGVWGVPRLLGGGSREQRPMPNVSEPTSSAQPSVQETLPGTTPTNTSIVPPAPAPVETEEPAGEVFEIEIQVDENGASWLRVEVDGLKAYEGTLAAGESKSWDVTDEATVRIGKVTAVTLLKDGEPLEVPIGSDGIGEITIRAEE